MLKRDTRSGFMQCKISLIRVLRARANHSAVFRGGIPGVFVSYVSSVLNRTIIMITLLMEVGNLTNESDQS